MPQDHAFRSTFQHPVVCRDWGVSCQANKFELIGELTILTLCAGVQLVTGDSCQMLQVYHAEV